MLLIFIHLHIFIQICTCIWSQICRKCMNMLFNEIHYVRIISNKHLCSLIFILVGFLSLFTWVHSSTVMLFMFFTINDNLETLVSVCFLGRNVFEMSSFMLAMTLYQSFINLCLKTASHYHPPPPKKKNISINIFKDMNLNVFFKTSASHVYWNETSVFVCKLEVIKQIIHNL